MKQLIHKYLKNLNLIRLQNEFKQEKKEQKVFTKMKQKPTKSKEKKLIRKNNNQKQIIL